MAAPRTSAETAAAASAGGGGSSTWRPAAARLAQTVRHTRDVRALARFEMFLFSAVATVLLLRAFLAATGYPQVGGSSLHIAHVLWGGLLMGIAIVVVEIIPGTRARNQMAVVGGIGFGLFIDEVGKFLTKDTNYFFKPAVAIMYAVFVGGFLLVREIVVHRALTDDHRVAVAAIALADLGLEQLDSVRLSEALAELDLVVDPEHTTMVHSLRTALNSEPTSKHSIATRLHDAREQLIRAAVDLLSHKWFNKVILVLAGIQAVALVAQFGIAVLKPALLRGGGSPVTDIGTQVSSAVAALVTVLGGVLIIRGRKLLGLRTLQRAVIVDLMFTQIFMFVRYQLGGVVGFLASLLAFGVLDLAIRAEVGPYHGLLPKDEQDEDEAS